MSRIARKVIQQAQRKSNSHSRVVDIVDESGELIATVTPDLEDNPIQPSRTKTTAVEVDGYKFQLFPATLSNVGGKKYWKQVKRLGRYDDDVWVVRGWATDNPLAIVEFDEREGEWTLQPVERDRVRGGMIAVWGVTTVEDALRWLTKG